MDAVNELKGDLSNTRSPGPDDKLLYWDINGKYYICAHDRGLFCNADYICTNKEFNDLVSQLETNFGLSVNYDTYKEVFHKSSMSFTNCIVSNDKPVFTQAMADNGELPGKGVKCQGYVLAETKAQGQPCNKWIEGYFIQKAQGPNGGMCFLFESAGGHSYILNAESHIKPIDTRTDKEKAIAKAINNLMFFGDQTQTEQKANETLIAIMEGKVAGVKWVGE